MIGDEGPSLDDPRYFERLDESADTLFYQTPRLVIHVDEHASSVLARWYGETLPAGGDVLDLMSAWRSHLPDDARYRSVVGLGMNAVELNENPALSGRVIEDINRQPSLPFADASFDACLIAFSLQYLTQPVAVLTDVARVLRPGGALHVAYTNRLFPTKAVAIWQACSDTERAQLVAYYARSTGAFAEVRAERLVDPARGSDPLYVVTAAKA